MTKKKTLKRGTKIKSQKRKRQWKLINIRALCEDIRTLDIQEEINGT